MVVKPKPTCVVSASPTSLPHGGGNTNLSWSSNNATSASINQSIGSVGVTGTKSVFVGTTRTFTLTVSGPGGTATCDAPVTVLPPVENPTPSCALTVSPTSITKGGSARVNYSGNNVSSVIIKKIVGSTETTLQDTTSAVTGSLVVSPTETTKYRGTFSGQYGTVSCEAVLTVTPVTEGPEPLCTLTANPQSHGVGGGQSTLTWDTALVLLPLTVRCR
jgi:hypothetical protein